MYQRHAKTANKVGETTSMMPLADLAKKREHVKRINQLRGLPEDAPISIAIDSRFYSTSITGAYHAGQNASQAITVAVEKQTEHNEIVGINIQNKLCTLCASLRRRGAIVTCPGHTNCTATLPITEPLFEYGGRDRTTVCSTRCRTAIHRHRWRLEMHTVPRA